MFRIDEPSQLGPALRARRVQLQITQDELAEVIGVNRRVIGELERGKVSVRFEIVFATAHALGLDVELRTRGS